MSDFIRKKISEDIEKNNFLNVNTRFPPEPNGYLHIGHAKSICLNFGIAKEFQDINGVNARCNLRFDDTDPAKEELEYVNAIKEDIHWLGWDWEDREFYTSNYFEKLYQYAVVLIKKNLAYVDHLSAEEIKDYRGTPTTSGKNSPYRERTVEENLDLFNKMKNAEFQEGECLLRAKIDMSHANIVMRDPAIYRIKKVQHHNTLDSWVIYPMYDFAHCLSDAIEGITHSLCTLEFEIHRPLYDWFLEALEFPKPRPIQIEFARLNISYMVMSKRKLKYLVDSKLVDGWDDPRMPTISGLRRRGYTPSAIRNFCKEIGLTKTKATEDIARLEECLRDELNTDSVRSMVVIDPVKLIIDNYVDTEEEIFKAKNNPNLAHSGEHDVYFSKEVYVERKDIAEDPPKGFNRICIGQEVRLMYAYYIRCTKIVKDDSGKIIKIHADYDPESKGGGTADNRKVKGTIHWVSSNKSIAIQTKLLDVLFTEENPEAYDEIMEIINPNSLSINDTSIAEPYLLQIVESQQEHDNFVPIQFMRNGYYCYDKKSSEQVDKPVFNLTVSLKDSWNKK